MLPPSLPQTHTPSLQHALPPTRPPFLSLSHSPSLSSSRLLPLNIRAHPLTKALGGRVQVESKVSGGTGLRRRMFTMFDKNGTGEVDQSEFRSPPPFPRPASPRGLLPAELRRCRCDSFAREVEGETVVLV
eukprot:1043771-Rhodomonas_salina.1